MPKALRRKVHLLAENYNLRSQSLGSGKKRSPMLVKTHQTRIPPSPVNIHKLLNQSEQELKKVSIQRRMDKQAGGGGRGPRGGRDGNAGSRPVHGTVVGAEASAISIENKGHRMLAKMGYAFLLSSSFLSDCHACSLILSAKHVQLFFLFLHL